MSNETAIRMMTSQLREADTRLRKFAADLERYPDHAFEWSLSAFEAAATKRVFTSVVDSLQNGAPLAEVRASAQREVNAGAKRGSRSTSDASNLMTAERMSAWARVLEILQYEEQPK